MNTTKKRILPGVGQLPLNQQLAYQLHEGNRETIVLVVADGLGGLPWPAGGQTELETARTPHLDWLAQHGVSGRIIHVGPGITPGSGPGHLSLFGYDPIFYRIGRGIIEALGSGFAVQPDDAIFRGNLATIAADGTVSSRKADGIATEETATLVRRLRQIQFSDRDVQLLVEPLRDHRFLLVLRGPGLGIAVSDTDPLVDGKKPFLAAPLDPRDEPSCRTASLTQEFIDQAYAMLGDRGRANGILLRGCSSLPQGWPMFPELYGVAAAAYAAYPMYRGLARLVGMEVIGDPADLEQEIDLLQTAWDKYDFHFLHFKRTDREAEFGRFHAKVFALEQLDNVLPRILDLQPSVLIVTGDHSTPATRRAHSWHPVPVVLFSESCCPDRRQAFGERESLNGGLGDLRGTDLMLLALAHAGRLRKYE
jgi:2,3-bisphosphoglycerate-independent phosphoglycerate mutase